MTPKRQLNVHDQNHWGFISHARRLLNGHISTDVTWPQKKVTEVA